jgi:hypothetical protein
MAASVQGWRKKWFYIKDQKVSSSDQYGVAPFTYTACSGCQGLNLWHFFCNIEFSLFSIVFLNFGRSLAWEILLEYLMILWRRRISTNE